MAGLGWHRVKGRAFRFTVLVAMLHSFCGLVRLRRPLKRTAGPLCSIYQSLARLLHILHCPEPDFQPSCLSNRRKRCLLLANQPLQIWLMYSEHLGNFRGRKASHDIDIYHSVLVCHGQSNWRLCLKALRERMLSEKMRVCVHPQPCAELARAQAF